MHLTKSLGKGTFYFVIVELVFNISSGRSLSFHDQGSQMKVYYFNNKKHGLNIDIMRC